MLVPVIHFPGTCAQAIALYQEVFGAQVVQIAYNRDAPADSGRMVTEETRDMVMHAEVDICQTRLNMSDMEEEALPNNMFLFNVFLDSADEVKAAFHKLREGGEVLTELGPQFWTSLYGEIVDRFGVRWQVMAKQ